MAEYQLYCFAQSGNAYRAALMLNLIGADWEPIFVDFFAKGEPRTPEYRSKVNEMGEVPVLVHGAKKLTQSGVILTYLAKRSGKFRPEGEDERARSAALDHLRQSEGQRLPRAVPLPAHACQAAGRSGGAGVPQGPDRQQSRRSSTSGSSSHPYVLGARPTIADLSMVAYLYYPAEEFGFDIAAQHKNIAAWLDRIKALPGWTHPYDLMPGHPLPGR